METYEHCSTHVRSLEEAKAKYMAYLRGCLILARDPNLGEFPRQVNVVGWLAHPQDGEPWIVTITQEDMNNLKAEVAEEKSWNGIIGGLRKGSEHLIKLDSGEYLYNDCGKYRSNLTFVGNPKSWKPTRGKYADYNVSPDGDITVLCGDFFKSRKGTNCFRPKEDGMHLLIIVDWGGAFNRTRGYCDFPTNIYHRRASSNGGGSGVSYWVIPVGWSKKLNIDEI